MKRILSLIVCFAVLFSTSLGLFSTSLAEQGNANRILQVSLEGSPDSLDPHVFSGSLSMWSTSMMHDFLIKFDDQLNIVPGLAKSWEYISDTEIKFILRDDAFFHNGRKVVAEDIKNTYERVLDEQVGSRYRAHILAIESIETNGESEVILKLSYPYSPLLARLTQVAIIPIEELDKIANEPVGCGPFKFSEYEFDQYIEMVKFEEHYDAENVKISGIRFTFLPEYNAARTAFLAGDLDILLWADPADIPNLRNQENATVVETELLALYYIGFDLTRAPFDDARIRKAIYLALDRQQYVDQVLQKNGKPMYALVDPLSPYYDEKWTTQQRIDEAKKLLADAGFPDGFTTTVVTPNTPVEGPVGEILQSQLAAIGINVKLEKPDVATYLDQVFTRNDFEVMICGTTGFGDPDDPSYTFLHPDGSNYKNFKYQNQEVWDLLEKGRSNYTEEDRKQYYSEAFQIVYDEAPIIPIMNETRYSVIHNDIKGFVARQNLTYDFSHITFTD
ncbi:MAG: hypothetical protein GX577_10690 [Leptolinea sp.]|nr:hypothetical protein [Leptolinea sp.]